MREYWLIVDVSEIIAIFTLTALESEVDRSWERDGKFPKGQNEEQ